MKIVLAMPGSKRRLEKQIENMTEIAPYLRAWDAPYTDIKTNGLVPVTNANSK